MKWPSIRPIAWASAVVLWLSAVVVGMAVLMNYGSRPGAPAAAPEDWPAGSAIVRAEDRPTLVMLAHPRCDCTRASVTELAELLARAQHRPKAYVVFIKPGSTRTNWEQTSLWRDAVAIPGVTVVRDDDGVEARRFQVQTSGQVLLYDAHGRLIYAGGTTAARGKSGENAGRAAILAALDSPRPHSPTMPVFGCPLFGPADTAPDDHTDHPADSATPPENRHAQ